MRKVACELTLGNGGDVIAMVELDDEGTLKIPKHSLYGTFKEGVIACRVMSPSDREAVVREVWVENE